MTVPLEAPRFSRLPAPNRDSRPLAIGPLGVYPKTMAPVRIYTTDYCGYCSAAKKFLQSKGVPYEEIDVSGDDAARQALQARTQRNTVPQIFIGETHVGGYDDLRALDRAGRLQPLLQS